jgi:hypothetical protein
MNATAPATPRLHVAGRPRTPGVVSLVRSYQFQEAVTGPTQEAIYDLVLAWLAQMGGKVTESNPPRTVRALQGRVFAMRAHDQ